MGYGICDEEAKSVEEECGCLGCRFVKKWYEKYITFFVESVLPQELLAAAPGITLPELSMFGFAWFMDNLHELEIPKDVPKAMTLLMGGAFAMALTDTVEKMREKE